MLSLPCRSTMYYVCYSTDAFTSLEIVFLILHAVGVSDSIWWMNLTLFIMCWIWPVYIIQKHEHNMYHYTKKMIQIFHTLYFQNISECNYTKSEVQENQLYLSDFWGQQRCLISTLWPITSGQLCLYGFPVCEATSFPSPKTPLFTSIWWFWRKYKLSTWVIEKQSNV